MTLKNQKLTFLKKYFWETDFKSLDLKKDAVYIISRILEYGDIKAVKWLLKNFDKKLIKKVILTQRGFSPKTSNFWRLFFNLNKNKVLCLKKSYLKRRKSHWF
jgi:hypothetical protein